MTLQIVRLTTRPEQVDEVEGAVIELFSAIEQAQPSGIRYLTTRHSGPAAVRVAAAPGWALTAPTPETATVLSRYHILD